jgi:hypothetical protein
MDRSKLVRMVVVLSVMLLAAWPLAPAAAINGVVTADISPDCAGGRVTINGLGLYEVLIKVDGVTVLTLNLGPGSYPFTWPESVLADICHVHQATLEIGALERGPAPFGGEACCALKPVVIQQGLNGYAGAIDTYLNKWIPGKNYGKDGYIRTHTSGEQVGLLRFDLSALPADATIISATLWLHLEMGFRPNVGSADDGVLDAPVDATTVFDTTLIFPFHPGTLEIYKLLRGWNESAANWDKLTPSGFWDMPGGNGDEDREREPSAIADITLPMPPLFISPKGQQVEGPIFGFRGFSQWISAPVTSLVQSWMADPGCNQGVWMLAKSDMGLAYPFASSNNWNQIYHPKLILIYTTPE